MNVVEIGGQRYEVASEWNELSLQQVELAVEWVYQLRDHMWQQKGDKLVCINPSLVQEAQFALLANLFNGLLPGDTFFQLSNHALFFMLYEQHMVDFFFHSNTLTKNPLRRIEAKDQETLHGPQENQFPGSMSEFVFTDTLYLKYKLFKDEHLLNLFLAVLYRKAKPGFDPAAADSNGDIRERFNKDNFESRLPAVKELPLSRKIAPLLWYEACRGKMPKQFPNVFTPANDKGVGDSSSNWPHIILGLADGDVTKFHQVEDTPASLVFTELERRAIQIKKMKK